MSCHLLSLRFTQTILFILLLFVLISANSVKADFPILIVQAWDTSAIVGEQNVILPIYMQNFEDTVAAFTLKIYTNHPDVIQFHPGGIETSGTLISDWQYVTSVSDGINGTRIIALANIPEPPNTPGIGFPQNGTIPLVKLLLDIAPNLPDTMTTPIVEIIISHDIQKFNFSDEAGNTIGLGYDNPTFDTLYYDCMEWTPEPGGDSSCLLWEEVPSPPSDTMVVDTVLHPYLDTSIVYIFDGSIFIDVGDCITMGDANDDGVINIFDATYLISNIYLGGPELPRPPQGDVNCDCATNIFDVTCIISNLYGTGSSCVFCDCPQWESSCGGKY